MAGTFTDIAIHEGGPMRAYVTRPAQGSGPGLLLLHDAAGLDNFTQSTAERFAEEGYVVLAPELAGREHRGGGVSMENLAAVIEALRALPEHAGKVGAVGFGAGGRLAVQAAANADIDCAVAYYPDDLAACLDDLRTIRCPMVFHFAETQASDAFASKPQIQRYIYSGCAPGFAAPATSTDSPYDKPAALMAYSRTLGLLREVLGPVYDLDRLWEQHCYFEFATRDVDAVMPTMVAEPYVNHVPTMTGGVGYDELKRFYRYHFVHSNPDDTKLIPVSRTIGADRIVDEFVFCATHDREIDWLLPGLAPTGRYFEVPMLAVVRFRGDKLYNEHIYWDQASVLVQIGVLDPTGLPVAGRETARKMIDETRPSNTLMRNWASSEGKPV